MCCVSAFVRLLSTFPPAISLYIQISKLGDQLHPLRCVKCYCRIGLIFSHPQTFLSTHSTELSGATPRRCVSLMTLQCGDTGPISQTTRQSVSKPEKQTAGRPGEHEHNEEPVPCLPTSCAKWDIIWSIVKVPDNVDAEKPDRGVHRWMRVKRHAATIESEAHLWLC